MCGLSGRPSTLVSPEGPGVLGDWSSRLAPTFSLMVTQGHRSCGLCHREVDVRARPTGSPYLAVGKLKERLGQRCGRVCLGPATKASRKS